MSDEWVKLKNEHERIQKKVFTNWVNYYVPNCIEKDIINELRDGTKLIKLIEALTGDRLQCEKGKKLRRVHFISNVNKVLNYLEKRRIKLVNINATDIVDGNTCIILGLIWSLILRFQITQYFQVSNQDVSNISKNSSPLPSKSSKTETTTNTRQILLDKLNKKFDLNAKNFSRDWRDGFNLLKIVDKLKPSLNAVQRGLGMKSNLERIELALNLANDDLNVKKLLDAIDIDLDNSDEKCLMTYLSQFLQKYPQFDINQNNIQPQTSNLLKQPTIDSSKLFEEQILSHERQLIQDFIDKVYISGINLQNLYIYSNQFNNLEPIYKRTKDHLSIVYQNKWNLIKDELEIAKRLQDLIRRCEQQIKNYRIPCSHEQCKEQLMIHCNYFNDYESNLKSILNKPVLIQDLVNNYNQCIEDAQKWKVALEKASKMWQVYEKTKNKLMTWLQEADSLLLKSHEPKLDKQIRREHLENLKSFFSNRDENEKILKEFIVACEDVLTTLEEENKPELRSTLTGLVNRFYKIINYSAPQHLIKFEFDFIESDFFDKVRSFQNLNKDQQVKCESSIVNDLLKLEDLSSIYWNSFNDKTLLDKAIGHKKEWDKYKKRLDDNYKMINQTTINLQNLVKEAEFGVNLAKNNKLKSEILVHNENLFQKIHSNLNNLKNLEEKNKFGLGADLNEIENRIEQLLLDLNLVIEDKILDWCKIKDRTRLPSPTNANQGNNQKFLIQKIDFYSKLVGEFEKYEGLIARGKQLIDELNAKLDELARKPINKSIDEVAINYKICSHTIESTINKILDEVREINNRLKDHNYMEELHANEILNELKRLKQRNEEQYSYLVENFSKDLLKQIEMYRTKCEHCKEIADLKSLLIEVRDLNTTSVHKLEHLNLSDVLLHDKLLGNLKNLIKMIDEKCGSLMNGLKGREDEKRVRITTELTQKKIIEEIDGSKCERSSQFSEYNFKDLSNLNPFYHSTSAKQPDNSSNQPIYKPAQSNFGQQFNLSQENLVEKVKIKKQETTLLKEETILKEPLIDTKKEIPVSHLKQDEDKIKSNKNDESKVDSIKKPRRESLKIEAEKERIEIQYKKEQERIENQLNKERERLEEEARERKLKIEEDARKERERIDKEMEKEKEKIEQQRLIERDNELIDGLNEQIDKLLKLIESHQIMKSQQPEQTNVNDLKNYLINLKELCIQAKYIKDTQLNDKNKIKELETKLNQITCNLLSLIESEIADDLGETNFDLSQIDNLEKTILNLDDNINRIEDGVNLITNFTDCQKEFDEIVNWINDTKEKVNFLPYETIENLIDQYKQFSEDFDIEDNKLESTSDKLNCDLKYSTIIKTPYSDNLKELKTNYTEKCKEIFDDLSTELKDKALNIEQQAKECDSFNDFNRVNQELIKLKTNNQSILNKVKEEPNLEIISELSEIDDQLNELGNKLEKILDEKAIELVHYNEFILEPSDLKVDFDNLEDKSEYYAKLQDEIEHYKDLLIDNDIFLENLRKKLNEVNLKPVEEAIRLCQIYAENISNQIDKLQNSLEDLNKHLVELGCLQELSCNKALDELNKLKLDYENKLDQLIDELVALVKANLDELKNNQKEDDTSKDLELQIVDLDKLISKFENKINKLNIQDNSDVREEQEELDYYKGQLNDKYEDLQEQEHLKLKEEEEKLRKLEEQRIKEEAEAERLRKLEEQRLKEEAEKVRKLEEQRLKEEAEAERLRKLEERRLKEETERVRKLEEQKIKEEAERLRKLEEQRLKEETERVRKLEEQRLKEEAEAERLRKLEEQRLKEESERLKKLEEKRLKEEAERVRKLEEQRLKEETDKVEHEKENLKQERDDFSSANNLSKDERDENDNLNEKRLKKVVNNKHIIAADEIDEEPIAIVKIKKMPQKALLTNTIRMYSIENYSELDDQDLVDGEPIIEFVNSDNELKDDNRTVENLILEEIREMLKELKANQIDSSNLANLINELKNIQNICLKMENVKSSKENLNPNLDNQLKQITDQLNEIFKAIKDILNTQIPNLDDNIPKDPNNRDLIDQINLYTEIVTEFDKFDSLVNNNNDFINEIKNQLRKIDNKSLDHKLIDYRDLLDKINEQINKVQNEISNMNENLQELKYKESLDDRLTLEELEKLKKLCEDHMENSIEDLYISYIPKLNSLDNYLNQTTELNELESILKQMIELKSKINEKVNNLDLNGSPLIKNLLDLAEKLKNKIETKIEDKLRQRNDAKDNLINEQLEQAMHEQNKKYHQTTKSNLKRPNEVYEENLEFYQKTTDQPEQRSTEAIYKHHEKTYNQQDTLKFTAPVLSSKIDKKSDQMSSDRSLEADQQLDEILKKLKKLEDSLFDSKLDYEQIKNKMNNLIDLISTIQLINDKKPNLNKLQEVTSKLNQVVDCLTKTTNEYIKKVCEQEKTKPDKSISDKLTNKNLDELLSKLKPRFESITEYRKFEKLTENNQNKIDALNKVINQLSNLPIDEKVKNLKDCLSNAERFTNDLIGDVKQINETLHSLKLISELKPNVTMEKYTEIKTTCRSDYTDLIKQLCEQAKSEIAAFNRKLNEAGNSEQLKELKKDVLNVTSQFEVEITASDLTNDLLIRETINKFKNLNKKIDEKINKLIKEDKNKFDAKIKKETKSHLIKSNSETLVGSRRIELVNTGNELIKFLKEMIIKLDKLIKESNPMENDLKSYLSTLKEVCNQSNFVRENEPQLNEELHLIDENLEIVRKNLINLITKNALDNLSDWRFESKSNDFELKNINFENLKCSNELNSKKVLEKIDLNSNLVNEYEKLNKLMNETVEWMKDFECKLDYLPLRTLEELLDNYKATIFSVEILKAKILDAIEMFNSRLEDCEFENTELLNNPILEELDILKERYEIKCKELFDNFTKESMRKINEYIKKCSNCVDRNEFKYMLNEVKEFDVMNTNRINKIIKSTQESLDKLLGKLKEDTNNNLETDETISNQPQSNLNSTLGDSNNMIYVCDICIDTNCICVPKLEETEIPVERKKRNTRTKRGSSARNSWNITPERLSEIEAQELNNNSIENNNCETLNCQELDEHLQFEIWLEAMSNTVDFLLNERKDLDETNFEDICLYLKKMQQLKHALKQNFNHSANSNKKILNQYKMVYLTLEREVCLMKRQVEKLRIGTAINLPIQNSAGRVVCQNGVHLKHFCSRFRRNFFSRLFKITIPLQLILLTMFGISSLLTPNNDDFRCSLRNSIGPTYTYAHGNPPV